MALDLNKALVRIAKLYTTNQLTMSASYFLMKQAVAEAEHSGHGGFSTDGHKHGVIFSILGLATSAQDRAAIEIGYNGNNYDWFQAGHRPEGWLLTRKELRQCTDPVITKTTAVETVADATCSVPEGAEKT